MSDYDVYLVGVGGQGVLTIGQILAETATRTGMPTSFYPTKGMAQRGGAVKAQLRLGTGERGPIISEQAADLVIAMERSEALKAVPFVRPNGEFLLFGRVWAPSPVVLGNAEYPDEEAVLETVRRACQRTYLITPDMVARHDGKPVPANIYVLGAALGTTRLGQVLRADDVTQTITTRWTQGVEDNLAALSAGLQAGRSIQQPQPASGDSQR